jgi:hypothetical protein
MAYRVVHPVDGREVIVVGVGVLHWDLAVVTLGCVANGVDRPREVNVRFHAASLVGDPRCVHDGRRPANYRIHTELAIMFARSVATIVLGFARVRAFRARRSLASTYGEFMQRLVLATHPAIVHALTFEKKVDYFNESHRA